MKFTYIMGTSFMKLRLFFHKVSSFIINTLFPPLRKMLSASRIKLCAEELQGLSPMSFSLLLKWLIQHLTELTSMASSPYTLLRCLWICIQLEPCAISNSITTLCLVHTSTTSAILHRYSVKCKCLEHQQSWWSWTALLSGGQGNKPYPAPKKGGGALLSYWLLYDKAIACLHLLSCTFRENKFRTHIMADEAWKYPIGALHSFINHELCTRSDNPITICIQQT